MPRRRRSAPLATIPIPGALSASLQEGVRDAEEIFKASRAPATRRAYAAQWTSFEEWCHREGLPSLPAAPDAVALYLTILAKRGRPTLPAQDQRPLAVGSVDQAYAAIAKYHAEAGHVLSAKHRAIHTAMEGIRRLYGTRPKRKTPLVDDLLRQLLEHTDHLRDRAVLTLGWMGAFRRSELVSLLVEDVTFTKDGLVVLLRKSKTDQQKVGQEVGVPFAKDPKLCSVLALQAFLAGRKTGKIFEITPQVVASIVKRACERAGLSPEQFAGHSLRSGLATTAARHGKSVDEIMRQTRHKTADIVIRDYIRPASLFTNNAAKGLL